MYCRIYFHSYVTLGVFRMCLVGGTKSNGMSGPVPHRVERNGFYLIWYEDWNRSSFCWLEGWDGMNMSRLLYQVSCEHK
jgi:hypothetical protein